MLDRIGRAGFGEVEIIHRARQQLRLKAPDGIAHPAGQVGGDPARQLLGTAHHRAECRRPEVIVLDAELQVRRRRAGHVFRLIQRQHPRRSRRQLVIELRPGQPFGIEGAQPGIARGGRGRQPGAHVLHRLRLLEQRRQHGQVELLFLQRKGEVVHRGVAAAVAVAGVDRARGAVRAGMGAEHAGLVAKRGGAAQRRHAQAELADQGVVA